MGRSYELGSVCQSASSLSYFMCVPACYIKELWTKGIRQNGPTNLRDLLPSVICLNILFNGH